MKLKDLDKIIEPVDICIRQKGVAWYKAELFRGDYNDYYRYTRIYNPSIMERKIFNITAINSMFSITIE